MLQVLLHITTKGEMIMVMTKYQTRAQVLLDILLDEVKEDIRLSDERMVLLADDLDSLEVEKVTNAVFKDKLNSLMRLIENEKGYSSAPTVVEISHINKFNERIHNEEWTSDLLEGEHNQYVETGITLKDYRKLEVDKIYIFDNLLVRFDGEALLTKYAQETMWYEMEEGNSYFMEWADRILFEMN